SLHHAVDNPTGPNDIRDQKRRPKRACLRDQRRRRRSKVVAEPKSRAVRHSPSKSQTRHIQHYLPAAFSHHARNENHADGKVSDKSKIISNLGTKERNYNQSVPSRK